MQVKLLEIRDRATFIPVFAFQVSPTSVQQHYLARSVGFTGDAEVVMGWLHGERVCTADPYYWDDRTLQTAHNYIRDNWLNLADGDVIDVEFILGESKIKKVSQRFGDE